MDAQQLQSLVQALEAYIKGYWLCLKRHNTSWYFRSYWPGQMAALDRKSTVPIALATGTERSTFG